MNLKNLLKWRILILIFFLIISVIAINPKLNADGVAIKGIEKNSSAATAGIQFDPKVTLTKLERITEINGVKINTIDDYANEINKYDSTDILRIKTDKKEYILLKGNNLGLNVGEIS